MDLKTKLIHEVNTECVILLCTYQCQAVQYYG